MPDVRVVVDASTGETQEVPLSDTDLADREAAALAAAEAEADAPPTPEERIAALEVEVRGIRERAAAADVAGEDARKVRDAVAGPQT